MVDEFIKLWKEVEWGTSRLFVGRYAACRFRGCDCSHAVASIQGAIIVTTPQVLSTKAANKAICIAQKIGCSNPRRG